MKTPLIITALIVSICSYTYGQNGNFEGTVRYAFKYKDKTEKLSPKEVKKLMGNQQIYYFKSGKYKSKLNGAWEKTSYYSGGDTLHSTKKEVRALLWIYLKKAPPGEVISYKITRKAKRIKSWKCDLLEVKTTEGTILYYFHPQYPLNPESFAAHKYRFWDFCIQKTGALPIKFVYENNNEYLEITAEIIRERTLKAALFKAPRGYAKVKDPQWKVASARKD